ncbi:MAG: hypothetical protein IH955_04490 [Chloroflexi bacterium]|nr:hypothetical protein [Chloroflexota bacterium]
MNTKPFVILIMVIVLIGGGIGGAVALTLGSGDEGSATQSAPDTASPGASLNQDGTAQSGSSSDPGDPAQPSQGSDEGQVDANDSDGDGEPAQGLFGQGFAGRGGLAGTIESFDGETLTVVTAEGSVRATVTETTSIQELSLITPDELSIGLQITVVGQPGDGGGIVAQSITVNEGGFGEVEGGAFGGGGFLGGTDGDQFTPEDLAQLREQLQSGEIDPETLEQLRQQFQDRSGQGFGGRGFGGRGFGDQGFTGQGFRDQNALTGAIEGIEGNTVTVNTSQGPLQVTVGDDTIIQRFAEAASTDLQEGKQITVFGQSGEDGTVEATFILITPEGAGGFFGGGFFGGDGLQNELPSP